VQNSGVKSELFFPAQKISAITPGICHIFGVVFSLLLIHGRRG
jgi:hypothetical protein